MKSFEELSDSFIIRTEAKMFEISVKEYSHLSEIKPLESDYEYPDPS